MRLHRVLLAAVAVAQVGLVLPQISSQEGGSYSRRAPSKVFRGSKTYQAGQRQQTSRFPGGCDEPPPPPMNSVIKCSTYSGCRAKCMVGHRFPNGDRQIMLRCEGGVWTPPEPFGGIPDCEAVCRPECQNGGRCVAGDVCQCRPGFEGARCQVRSVQCTEPQPTIYNARLTCSRTRCTVTCSRGYETANQRTSFDIECSDELGWTQVGDRASDIPACQPICRPQCENGGRCVAFNLCQCPQQFRGPSCQWPASNCDPKTQLTFNGGYNCSGHGDQFGCRLFCPEGVPFGSPPADVYQCDYSTGQFGPQPIPQCDHEYEVIAPTAPTFLVPKMAPEARQCALWGGKHVKTFDGLVYSFTGGCSFTAVRDQTTSLFRVIVTRSCERPDCDWNLLVAVDQTVLTAAVDSSGQLAVAKQAHQRGAPTEVALPAEVNGVLLERVGRMLVITARVVGLTIHFTKGMIVVLAEASAWATVTGLCGTMDGSPHNDLLPSGLRSTLLEYASTATCAAGPPNADLRCSRKLQQQAKVTCSQALVQSDVFSPCRQVLDASSFVAACEAEYCYTMGAWTAANSATYYAAGSDGAASAAAAAVCATYAAYAAECSRLTSQPVSWRSEQFCPLSCPAGQVFSACGVRPSDRCGTPLTDSWPCEEGCACPDGLLMDGEQCVQPPQCSCLHNGVRHQAGDTVARDCNTCTCTSGEWLCTDAVCPSQCVVAGDPHYLTFDGVRFDYQGKCSYYLVKSDDYSVSAENVPCSGAISEKLSYHPSTIPAQPSCTKSVRIDYKGVSVHLKQGLQVLVDGEALPIVPWWVDGVYIKYASSMYISVTLPNGLEVWWDGETRAVVHSPGELTDSVWGLCGNNNNNQRDDFRTPEDDIETDVLAFASKWKVDESCDDQTKPANDPCEVYAEKYPEAVEVCDQIVAPMFKECHSAVDPAPFVKNCLYDICSCRAELKDCYCVHLADYAAACAAQGIVVQWRAEVGVCGVSCPYGQQYEVCGDSCAHSCFDLGTDLTCERHCVEGCQCPPGLTLDSEGHCTPISTCPCVFNNKEYRPGHTRYQGKGKTLQQCECVNARWTCQLAKHQPLDTGPTANCDATKHRVYADCLPAHQSTCKNRNMPPPESSKSRPYACEPGCVCDDGFVLDAGSGLCVTEDQCPCHHGNRAFANGQTITTECRSCTCHNGMWSCEEQLCDGICTAWGNSHYKTFDGRIYDIEGDCQYMLAKGKLTNKKQFEVIVTNVPCGSGSTCPKAVTVRVGSGADAEVITLEDGKPLPSAVAFTRVSIRQAGAFAFVESPSLGLVIQWDYGTRIYIRLAPQWMGKLKGLCGNFDSNPGDDFRGPSGLAENTAIQFAEQYKLQPQCPDTTATEDFCKVRPERHVFAVRRCAALKSDLFAACHAAVDVAPFLQRCVLDTCACASGGDCECLCTAVAAYGQACSNVGVHVRWRSNDLCPIQCDDDGSRYDACVSACPPKTCENRYIYDEITTMCAQDTCVEGCLPRPCKEGQVYNNSSLTLCVKEAACRTPCTVINDEQLYEGDVVSKDSCHVCYCTRGQVKCRGSACPVVTSTPSPPAPPTPDAAVPPITLQVCKPGWSRWVNRNRPLPYTRPNDVERIPAFVEPIDQVDALVSVVDLVPGSSDQVNGRLTFVQKSAEEPLVISGEITGLTPGKHGFHVHAKGRTGDQCRDAGGHFNPAGVGHSDVASAVRHVGDLGNIVADSSGLALVRLLVPAGKTSLFGDQSVVGLALVVHAGADDLGRGGDAGSRATGNAGARLACGIIRRAYDNSTGPAFCADNQVTNVRCRTSGTNLPLSATGDEVTCSLESGLVCRSDFTCQDYELQVFCDCSIEPTELPPTEAPPPVQPPAACDTDAWTPWMSAHTPAPGDWTDFEDVRSLRAEHTFCKDHFINAIECRTKLGRLDITKVGGGAVCDLNHGLICSDALGYCDDFEVRFFCNCDEPIAPPTPIVPDEAEPCSALTPLSQHETDCHKFYQCVPLRGKIEKTCGADMMFNPSAGVCDYPAAVAKVRPECGPTTTPGPMVHCDELHPVRAHPTDCHQYYQCVRTANDELSEYLRSCGPHMMYNPDTMTCDSIGNVLSIRPDCGDEFELRTPPTAPPLISTAHPCPIDQTWDDCRIRCDQLCHYYSGFLVSRGFCQVKDACKPGCVDEHLSYQGCPAGFSWKDEGRCVKIYDCNCRLPNGKPLGPGQTIVAEDDCSRTQCLNNQLVVDSTDCRTTATPTVSTHAPATTATTAPPPPSPPPSPSPECDKWGEWIDNADPNVGEYEVEMLPWWLDFCTQGHKERIECEVVGTGASFDTTGDVDVSCNVASGLTCQHSKQPGGRCHNYRVRYFCSCEVPPVTEIATTTETPTTPVLTTTPTTTETPTWPPVIPPTEEHCDVARFLPLLYGEEPLPDSAFSASDSLSAETQPSNVKILDQFQDSGRSWMPSYNDQEQYVQMDLGSVQPIYAVKVVGNSRLKASVVDFHFFFSDDGVVFRPLTDTYGLPQTLTAVQPLGEAAPVVLPTAVEARHVRLVPRSWQQRIAVKLEVYGCRRATEPPPTTRPPITVSTVEPPPHCDDTQFIPLLNGDHPLPDNKITASSVIGPEMAAHYAKIRTRPEDRLRSWVPKSNNQNQYLQVDLGVARPVYAVLVLGNKAISSSVTQFQLLYSLDGNIYTYAVDKAAQPATLTATDPMGEPEPVILPVAVEGRYLRLHPVDWHTRIALKLELYGCSGTTAPPPTTPTPPPRCLEPMGLENGLLHDSLIKVSSQLSDEHDASAVRPGSAGWIPSISNNKQYIRIDFSDDRVLDAIATTGVVVRGAEVPGYPNTLAPDQTRYVGSYRVRYSQDGVNWIWVYNKSGRVKVFPGHTQRTALSTMQNEFEHPIHAQYLELEPETWAEDGIGATIEVLGCYHAYPEVTTTTTTTEAPEDTACQPCAGVPATEMAGCELCGSDAWWNGTSCLDGPALCPCYYQGRPYVVGSIFDLSDCRECVCQLGGKPVCEPKTCHPCGGELVSHLSESCLCQCNPCEEGTRICPTSRTCLEEEKWCDGVKQCPDDEGDECREATTTVPPPTVPVTKPPILPQYCTLKGNTFNTFDDVEYKYQICHHTLVKEEGLWDVSVHRVCEGDRCRRQVRIDALGERVTLVPGVGVEYGGYTYDMQQASALRSKAATFTISTTGQTILFNSPDIGFAVLVNDIGNVVVGVNNKHFEAVRGLCGDFDGNKYNDKQTPAGQLADSTAEFGDSWALVDETEADSCEPETCEHSKEAFAICQKIRLVPFSRCHSSVPPDSFISSCLETTCACLDAGLDSQECRCTALTAYVTECLSLDASVDLSSWRTKHQCPSECPPGEVYRDCYRPTCEPSCDRLEPCDILPDICFQGCYCPDGQVRQQGRCVDPVDCRDCHCGVYPGGSFESFDKEERILKTNCTYLAAGREETNGKYNFKVLVDSNNCRTTYGSVVTCSTDVLVQWADHEVIMRRSGSLIEVFVDGAMVEGFYHEYSWGSVAQPPKGSVLLSVPALHLEASLHPESGALSVRLPSKVYGGSVGGVCGNCDGSPDDEAATPPSYWLLDHDDPASCVTETPECVPPPAELDPCQKMLDDALFGSCHLLEEPEPFVAACQRRICDDHSHDVCDELELYARHCYERGLCVQWRSQELCGRGSTCPPTMEYHQCTGTCLKSCDKRDCPLLEQDGCFCPEGQVFEDSVCVDENQCKFCDEEGHRPGDSWRPDNCTSCRCLASGSSQCTSVECPAQTALMCHEGQTPVELAGTGSECCPPRYECRQLTTTTTEAPPPPPVYCPAVVTPTCDPAEGKLVEQMVVNGCPVALCVCVPADRCPPLERLRELKPGERVHNLTKTCCPRPVIRCDAGACSPPPACPADFLLHTPAESAADCCPPQYCRQPPDTCLVRLDVAIDIRAITAANTDGFVVKRAGDVWSDGFCNNCTCRAVPDGEPRYQPVCVELACARPPAADVRDYVYDEDDDDDDECCPRQIRVACRDNGREYQAGGTWSQLDQGRPVDACVTWECARDENQGLVKVPSREKCVEDCRPGYTYTPARPGSGACCGQCEQTACVSGGKQHAEGEVWKSDDKCTEFSCERDFFDGQLSVLSTASLCRDVSDCPPENLYSDETGCCQRCNRTDNCHVKVVPSEETVGMFKEGDCANLEAVGGLIRCQGACDSLAFFDSDSASIQSGCKCCGVTSTRLLALELTCQRVDRFGQSRTSTIYQTFTVPDGCACSKCDSSSSELGGSAGAYWQQSTGEAWAQQSGLPFPDNGIGGDGDSFPWGGSSTEDIFSYPNGKDVEVLDTARGGQGRHISDGDFFNLLVNPAQPADREELGDGEIH